MVVQLGALLPCRKKVGCNPDLGSFWMEFACSPVHVQISFLWVG